ncbi:nucleotidyltransferase family protein [Lamprocystis purpurea]|uniref:nucleotidyltransferase family protein n=1 Tax=Lamprocystis purpurea TaxID=61598 RepID=UPI00036ECA0F|nr:nucleotidyltransferase domain-containing protein [Lamprocystis purpurea]
MSTRLTVNPQQRQLLLALLRQWLPGTLVWAYGSRVNGTARPNSDLDLVAFIPSSRRHLLSAAREALDESNLPFLVDLHGWSDLPARFHDNIRSNYVVLQAAEPSQWERKETALPLGARESEEESGIYARPCRDQ